MFNWPEITEGRGTITVTGRHPTPGRREVGAQLMACTSLALLVHPFFTTHSPANVAAFKAIVALLPTADRGTVWAWFLIGQFVLGLVVGGVAGDKLHVFGWLVNQRTTVQVDADTVRVHGIGYSRGRAAVQFTNLYPHTFTLGDPDGGPAAFGSLAETSTLRLFYGANAVIVAEFLTARQAGRFALACNAALDQVVSPAARGFEVIPVADLYHGGPATALPPGLVRRRR